MINRGTSPIYSNPNVGTAVKPPVFKLGRSSGTIHGPDYYIFKAHYKYEIDGEAYNSERVSFLSKYISKERKNDIENKYAEGKTIDIFYNPDIPSESVLITGVNEYNENPYSLLGIILFCIGIFILIIYGNNRGRSPIYLTTFLLLIT